MAQKIITTYIDDLDNTEGEDIATRSFGFEGKWYELDLNEKNTVALYEFLARYRAVARPVRIPTVHGSKAFKASPKAAQAVSAAAGHADPTEVRVWAASDEGMAALTAAGLTQPSDRGRISKAITSLFLMGSAPAVKESEPEVVVEESAPVKPKPRVRAAKKAVASEKA